jgi:hypothetical protein
MISDPEILSILGKPRHSVVLHCEFIGPIIWENLVR